MRGEGGVLLAAVSYCGRGVELSLSSLLQASAEGVGFGELLEQQVESSHRAAKILIMNSQSTSRMKVYFIFLISIVTGVKGDCRSPPRLTYAELTTPSQSGDTFTTGQKVLYSCRPGYIRTGTTPNSLTCLADSTWSSPATPFCELRKCPVPEEISNGRADFDTITFGSTVTYKCDEGYKFISKVTTRECQPDGTWSGVPPVCEVQVCVPPSPVVDGSYSPVKDEYEYSNSVLYTCNSGLSLIGTDSIFCKADATWSAAAPECRDVKCLDPHVANSERVSGFTGPYGLNSAITFKCKSGFVMDGSASIKCDENSAWSPLPPTCKDAKTDGGSQGGGGNNVGAIVGGIIGALVLIAIIVGIIYYKKRQGSVSPSNSNYKSGDTPDGKSTSHQKPVDQAPMNQIQSQNQQEIPC